MRAFDRRFWAVHALIPALLLGAAIALFELTDLDLWLSNPFYDQMRGGWYLKHSWWAEGLIHRGGRDLILALGCGALLIWLLGFFRAALRPWRQAALYLLLCISLGTGLVALGKATIDRHPPWECDRYGGQVPYVRIFSHSPAGYPAGHGFPAGHASGGFALMGCYFVFRDRDHHRQQARAGLWLGLATGTLFAIGQQVRGAHFASHNLWTILICWFTALLLYTGMFRGRLFAANLKGHPQ